MDALHVLQKNKGNPCETSLQQGSLHYTPEHCLVNGGFFILVEKAMFQMGKMYLLRSPVQYWGHPVLSQRMSSDSAIEPVSRQPQARHFEVRQGVKHLDCQTLQTDLLNSWLRAIRKKIEDFTRAPSPFQTPRNLASDSQKRLEICPMAIFQKRELCYRN